jgi:hypothetical protein
MNNFKILICVFTLLISSNSAMAQVVSYKGNIEIKVYKITLVGRELDGKEKVVEIGKTKGSYISKNLSAYEGENNRAYDVNTCELKINNIVNPLGCRAGGKHHYQTKYDRIYVGIAFKDLRDNILPTIIKNQVSDILFPLTTDSGYIPGRYSKNPEIKFEVYVEGGSLFDRKPKNISVEYLPSKTDSKSRYLIQVIASKANGIER